jgi:hypothetical protein
LDSWDCHVYISESTKLFDPLSASNISYREIPQNRKV